LVGGGAGVDDRRVLHPPGEEAPVSSIRWFKVIAVAEAVSYLLLLAASVAKRTVDAHELVAVMGPIHGVIFLAYVALALYVRERLGWTGWTTVAVIVAAVVPVGGLIVERRVPDEPVAPASVSP
jgi:integral membrane protein